MAGADEAAYRKRLATGFLAESEDDAQRGRWRAARQALATASSAVQLAERLMDTPAD